MSDQWSVGILTNDDGEVLDFAGPFEVFSVTQQLDDWILPEMERL